MRKQILTVFLVGVFWVTSAHGFWGNEKTIREGSEVKFDYTLTVDGQVGLDLLSGDRIVFTRSEQKSRLVLSGYRTFYEVLSSKLKWGDTRRKS